MLLILFLFFLNRCVERWHIVEENECISNTSDSLIKNNSFNLTTALKDGTIFEKQIQKPISSNRIWVIYEFEALSNSAVSNAFAKVESFSENNAMFSSTKNGLKHLIVEPNIWCRIRDSVIIFNDENNKLSKFNVSIHLLYLQNEKLNIRNFNFSIKYLVNGTLPFYTK